MLSKDLEKLKCLSELPEMLKKAIDTYHNLKKDTQPNGASQSSLGEEHIQIEELFSQPLLVYQDYNDILLQYKKTKFMQDLYTDIKQNIQKVKQILNTELDQVKANPVLMTSQLKLSSVGNKKLKDLVFFLLLIINTQHMQVGPSDLKSSISKESKEVLALKTQQISNLLGTYQNIKL